jgi:predicted transcriptional regulator
MEKHQMKEKQVAAILGISQSAISKYSHKVRGTTLPINNAKEIQKLVDQMLTLLIHEPHKKTEIMRLFCQACTRIRKDGLMCPFCKAHAPEADTKDCDFCTADKTSKI